MSSDEDEPLARKARKGGRAGSGGDSDNDDDTADEFPLEGKYINEADRARCVVLPSVDGTRKLTRGNRILGMSELDREGILGERSEKLNADRQRADLRRMVQEKERAEGGSGPSDAVTRSGGRDRKATGATSTKQKSLERLRRKREEKGKKAERRVSLRCAVCARERKLTRSARSTTTTTPLDDATPPTTPTPTTAQKKERSIRTKRSRPPSPRDRRRAERLQGRRT